MAGLEYAQATAAPPDDGGGDYTCPAPADSPPPEGCDGHAPSSAAYYGHGGGAEDTSPTQQPHGSPCRQQPALGQMQHAASSAHFEDHDLDELRSAAVVPGSYRLGLVLSSPKGTPNINNNQRDYYGSSSSSPALDQNSSTDSVVLENIGEYTTEHKGANNTATYLTLDDHHHHSQAHTEADDRMYPHIATLPFAHAAAAAAAAAVHDPHGTIANHHPAGLAR